MPTAREIESALYALAPKALAAEWDNVGLLVGDGDREVRRVLVAGALAPGSSWPTIPSSSTPPRASRTGTRLGGSCCG